jgi:transcriptional regulator with PAS, ATPase and Fis domain
VTPSVLEPPDTVPVPSELGLSSIVGRSAALRAAIDLSRKVASSRTTTVLLAGETGTGKELFARGVHYAGAASADPFVAVNCAAIPETLLESELFGHERGAFTDARAQKRGLMELAGPGTLFLDEIHHMPHSLQPKLLRVLESRRLRRLGALEEVPIACRIIAGTNVSLEGAVARGEFREDLFYRLNVFRITLPPLRERPDDVALLARHFLAEHAREHERAAKSLDPEAARALQAHSWPGNVRELKNVIERASILAGAGRVIRVEHLMIQQRTARAATPASGLPVADPSPAGGVIHVPAGGKTLHQIELEAVRITLQLSGGNRSEAARLLGISRPTLARKLQEQQRQQRQQKPRGQTAQRAPLAGAAEAAGAAGHGADGDS